MNEESSIPVQGDDFQISGVSIGRGERKQIELHVAKLFDQTDVVIPVEVIRGKIDGPIMFVSAAIHGDEINGVEIVKRLLSSRRINSAIHGTLIAVPIVNTIGFNRNIRYLPDRRDLNRCFPGSDTGSLGGQIAHIFMQEIVSKSTHGIDLHTAAIHRTNLPQIRATINDEVMEKLAHAFDVPIIINSKGSEGTLRYAAIEAGVNMLLYEGGEALRYNEKVIQKGLKGVFSVMQSIGMLREDKKVRQPKLTGSIITKSSYWIRAPISGSLRTKFKAGHSVSENEILGILSDPFGKERTEVIARKGGVIIGMTVMPLVNNGDALFHIATFEDSDVAEELLEQHDFPTV